MMSWRRGAFAVSLFCTVAAAQQAPTPSTTPTVTGFLAKSLTVGGIERRYVLYLPRDYRADRRWPLVVFLNGMGECGTDGWKHIDVGLGPAMRNEPERWPFVVLLPQKPDKPSQWIDHDDMVMAMVAATEKECAIDAKQRFLTGLSQGGAGTWAIGAKHKEMWAAIAPVCGYGKPADVALALKDMPIWAFHGEADPTVPVQQTKALVAAVEAAGGKPLQTLYPKVRHNSWEKAYGASGLAEWLRMVATDPAGARALAEPGRLDDITVTLTFRAAQTAAPRTERARWRAAGEGAGLVLDLSVDGSTRETRTFAATDGRTGKRLEQAVLAPLRELCRTGFLLMPGHELGGDEAGWSLELAMAGAGLSWQFRGGAAAGATAADVEQALGAWAKALQAGLQ